MLNLKLISFNDSENSVTVTKPVSLFGYEVRNELRASGIDTGIGLRNRASGFMAFKLISFNIDDVALDLVPSAQELIDRLPEVSVEELEQFGLPMGEAFIKMAIKRGQIGEIVEKFQDKDTTKLWTALQAGGEALKGKEFEIDDLVKVVVEGPDSFIIQPAIWGTPETKDFATDTFSLRCKVTKQGILISSVDDLDVDKFMAGEEKIKEVDLGKTFPRRYGSNEKIEEKWDRQLESGKVTYEIDLDLEPISRRLQVVLWGKALGMERGLRVKDCAQSGVVSKVDIEALITFLSSSSRKELFDNVLRNRSDYMGTEYKILTYFTLPDSGHTVGYTARSSQPGSDQWINAYLVVIDNQGVTQLDRLPENEILFVVDRF